MRPLALSALALVAAHAAAQSTIERWNTLPIPGNVTANEHVAFGASLLPNGNFSLSSTSRGASSSLTYFSSVNRSNGALSFFRPGQPYIETRGTAIGPGGRVAQFGSRSGTGADAMATVFNGLGTTLTTLFDGPLGPTYQEVITAAAFDSAGNLYVAGNALRVSPLFSTSFVARYNSAGVRQWVVTPNLASSPNGDRPVGMGVDPTGNIWVAISRSNTSTHVWRLNPSGVTLFGSVWQLGGQVTVPVTAKMANNRFVVVGQTGNPKRIFVRQYLNNVNWVTYDTSGVFVGESQPSDFTVDQFGTLYLAANFPNSSNNAGILPLRINNTPGAFLSLPGVQFISFVDRDPMGQNRPVYFVGRTFNGSFRLVAGHTSGNVVHTGTVANRIPLAAAFDRAAGQIFVASDAISSPSRIGATLVDLAPVTTNPTFIIPPFNIFDGDLRPFEHHSQNASFSTVFSTTRGFLTLNFNGTFTYVPDQSTNEPYDDSFTYTMTKPGLAPVTGNCSISVRP
jgi:hypothetical protein